ncbi:MAG: MGMT family protein [Rikenellaceae bacterium]|nr:MGMT family protein [Rikenellaceae bacterium]
MFHPCSIGELTEAVYEIVHLIPAGRATSYGAIARAVGMPRHSRLIGRILANSQDVPAHRVVNSQEMLSARTAFQTPTRMQELLEAEGIEVRNHRIVNWKTIFWNPQEEL